MKCYSENGICKYHKKLPSNEYHRMPSQFLGTSFITFPIMEEVNNLITVSLKEILVCSIRFICMLRNFGFKYFIPGKLHYYLPSPLH